MVLQDIWDRLKNPSEEFSPVPFWFFNDWPDRERIAAQLEDFVEKGVNAFVLHPRIGIPEQIGYLSEAYFETVRFVAETARRLGMKIVLYDEGMYPSGSAHGLVVRENPAFAARGLTRTDGPGADPVIAALPDGQFLVWRFTGGTIRGIHFGEDDGEAGAPPAADLLNPEAVRAFLRLTHDRYYEELREYFGTTVIGFFTDEPSPVGRNAEGFFPWAGGLERELQAAGGCAAELQGLFDGTENTSTEIYRRLIKSHLRETFYRPLSEWCSAHGIELMGHPEASDDVEEQLYFGVPGQDLILRRVTPKTGGLLEPDSVQAKLTADIARHLGRRRNANECFGVCSRRGIPWYFTGEDMKWYIDWLTMRGVNLLVPHAFYYSVEGARSGERPPDVGPNNIWWPHYRRFSDYIKRMCSLMTGAGTGARIAVLCDNNRVPCREVAALYERQIEFHYLPAALLERCRAEDGKLCIGECAYELVFNVLGDKYGAQLPEGVTQLQSGERLLWEAERRGLCTVLTQEPCPGLRAVRLYREGAELLLLSNEGERPLSTTVSLPGCESWAAADLWRGCLTGKGTGSRMELSLAPCETRLIFLGTERQIRELSPKEGTTPRYLGDWTEAFSPEEKADNRAVCERSFWAEEVCGTEYFTVRGEEMAECYVNGKLADVSFWNVHRLSVGHVLKKGENRIRLVFTGNAANLYDGAHIPFGLETVIRGGDSPSPLCGKTIYGFGDSLVAGHANRVGMLDFAARKNGMIYRRYAANGATIVPGIAPRIGDGWLVPDVASQVESASAETPDFVCFDGLTNDAEKATAERYLGQLSDSWDGGWDLSTFYGAFENVCHTLRKKYQDSCIFYVAVHRMPTRDQKTQEILQRAAREVCEKWAIPVVDMFRAGGINTCIDGMRRDYSYDTMEKLWDGNGTHLNEAGYSEWYAPAIERLMLGFSHGLCSKGTVLRERENTAGKGGGEKEEES
ncbi:MAG: SGNH/GDSL hydrolase family protein [Eubacteriales bacterium]|nr:SGNH/GDSL hydrolase family protein [Eubacteriales bacterium]